ncbi:hypothetical protein EFE14_09315 [Leuconostoc mesenteroides]|nr:hypothetical protein [Leuconostoc mesenteroides]
MNHFQSKAISLISIILYAITLVLVIVGNHMLAMYAMAIGMLTGSIVNFVCSYARFTDRFSSAL